MRNVALLLLVAAGLMVASPAHGDHGPHGLEPQPARIGSADNTTFSVGVAGLFKVTTTGSPTPTLTQSGELPEGVTFVSNGDGTGTLSGTPDAGTGGSYPLTFNAKNGISDIGDPDGSQGHTQEFTLAVTEAPAITSAKSATFAVGTHGDFIVTATGYPNPMFSQSGALPSGIKSNGSELTGTPAVGTEGSYPLTFTAANGISPDASQDFTLTVVEAADEAPAITSADSTVFQVGSEQGFVVTATGNPEPTLSQSGALPNGITFNPDTGLLSGSAASGTEGSYPLTFTATNGVAPDATQDFNLTVEQAAAPPPSCNSSPPSDAVTAGTPGDDVIVGTSGSDTISGLGGNDVIYGLGGNDVIDGGSGNDLLCGGIGSDRLLGGTGNDVIRGGSGNDRISGQDGNDTAKGEGNNDRLSGGAGRDVLNGGTGTDVLSGSTGDDRLTGSGGNDTLAGGPGRDIHYGGSGRDIIRAEDKTRDRVSCGPNRDRVYADGRPPDRVSRDCERVSR